MGCGRSRMETGALAVAFTPDRGRSSCPGCLLEPVSVRNDNAVLGPSNQPILAQHDVPRRRQILHVRYIWVSCLLWLITTHHSGFKFSQLEMSEQHYRIPGATTYRRLRRGCPCSNSKVFSLFSVRKRNRLEFGRCLLPYSWQNIRESVFNLKAFAIERINLACGDLSVSASPCLPHTNMTVFVSFGSHTRNISIYLFRYMLRCLWHGSSGLFWVARNLLLRAV